jgi:hypothetical protein
MGMPGDSGIHDVAFARASTLRRFALPMNRPAGAAAGGAMGVVILGMGRSGTSAVASSFARAGFFAGRQEDLMAASQANPMGHWENMRLWRVNETILSRSGGSWFDPPPVDAQLAEREWAIPALQSVVDQIIEHACGMPVVIKDPRIGVMMPLWGQILEGRFHPVLVVRDPVEIAVSLQRRDGTPKAFALAAWELHTAMLLDWLGGTFVTVAPYGCLVEHSQLAESVVAAATAHIQAGRSSGVRAMNAGGAFERGLRRNHATPGDHDEQLTRRQFDLWRFMSSLPPGDDLVEPPPDLRAASGAARATVSGETERVAAQRKLAELAQSLEGERADRPATGLAPSEPQAQRS